MGAKVVASCLFFLVSRGNGVFLGRIFLYPRLLIPVWVFKRSVGERVRQGRPSIVSCASTRTIFLHECTVKCMKTYMESTKIISLHQPDGREGGGGKKIEAL